MKNKLILDIGCGDNKKKKAIGIDCRKTKKVDIISDVHALPFKNESFDYIYSSHTIEHISHKKVKKVLEEWVRVLKKGGTIEIRCPDTYARALFFFVCPSWENMRKFYGGQDYQENFHKCGFSYNLLKKVLKENEIIEIKRVFDGYKGIPFLPNDLHVKGVKKSFKKSY